jgi:hypothetical protein
MLAGINHATHTNMITRFEASDIWPDAHHAADHLVARHQWVSVVTLVIADMV